MFFDGVAVDRTRTFDAHDVRALAAHWDELADPLAVVARIGYYEEFRALP